MGCQGSQGGEYSGATALKLDPEILTVNSSGVTHVTGEPHSPGAYAWQRDYSAVTGLAARVELDRGSPSGGSNQKFAASCVRKFTQPGAASQYVGAQGTVTYTATSITDTGQSTWGTAYFANQKIVTSDGKYAYTKLSAANSLLVYTDIGLTVAGWNGGTPGATATYVIGPPEEVYLLWLAHGGGTEDASLRLAFNNSGQFAIRCYYSVSGTPTQQGADHVVSLGTWYLLGLYADLGTPGGGEAAAWVQTDTVTIAAPAIDVTGLTGPGSVGAVWYSGHNATKGRYLTIQDVADDVVGFDSGTLFDGNAYNVVSDKTIVKRYYVSPWGLPTADGGTLQWTIGAGGIAGHQYTCIDDPTTAMPDGDTSYLTNSLNAGSTDSEFTMATCASLNVDSDQINLVQTRHWTKIASGSENGLPYVRDRGTQIFSDITPSNLSFQSAYSWFFGLNGIAGQQYGGFNADKNGAQWTRANIDAASWGLRANWVRGAPAAAHFSDQMFKIVFSRAAVSAGAGQPVSGVAAPGMGVGVF